MYDSFLYPLRNSTLMRLLVLFSSFMVLILVSGAISASFPLIPGFSEKGVMLLSAVVQFVVGFCLSAWITARFSSVTPGRFLGLDGKVYVRYFVGVIIVYILALPAMNQIIVWNANIHLPEWGAGIEATLREWEDANNAASEKILISGSVMSMLASVAVIGLLTGFSEELFFRGAFQRILESSNIRIWVAVWTTAAVFSAMHFQFFGFFPRLLMGMFFGYLFLWTGSIWPSAFAHTLNNTIVVVGAWAYGYGESDTVENIGVSMPGEFPWSAVMSAVATGIFFWKFKNYFFKNHGARVFE